MLVSLLMCVCVLLPILTCPVAYFFTKKSERLGGSTIIAVSSISLFCAIALLFLDSTVNLMNICGVGLSFSGGGFKGVLAVLCSFAFLASSLSSPAYFFKQRKNGRYYAFLMLTLGATLGVFLSADLFTTFVFFEVMSIASWVWVAQSENRKAVNAANTYLAVAIVGGLSMLFGVLLLNNSVGTTAFSQLENAVANSGNTTAIFISAICLTVGFGAKAGMFPLHIWLTKSYVSAPAPATALLSSVLSKAGIFGIIICSTSIVFGDARYSMLVLVLGVFTMLLGALMALVCVDIKKTLACSSLSQIGFILISVSMIALAKETALASGGALLHSINHTLVKLVLFIIVGVIYKATHTLNLNRLRGAARGNKLLTVCFLVCALTLSGLPLFGGYASKTLIHEAIVEHIHLFSGTMHTVFQLTEVLFLVAGGLTLAYMAKLFIHIFVEKSEQQKAIVVDKKTTVAIVVPTTVLALSGIVPSLTYEKVANFAANSLGSSPFNINYYSLENLKGALISISIGVVIYFAMSHVLIRRGKHIKFYTIFSIEEHLYKPLLRIFAFVGALVARVFYSVADTLILIAQALLFMGAKRRVEPKSDEHFAHYSRGYVGYDKLRKTLAFELMLFGIGVVLTLGYLILSL